MKSEDLVDYIGKSGDWAEICIHKHSQIGIDQRSVH